MSPQPNNHPPTELGRRRFLALGGAAAVGTGLLLASCRSDDTSMASSTPDTATRPTTDPTTAATTAVTTAATSSDTTPVTPDASTDADASGTPATTVFSAADFAGLGACVVLPELTQGPFPTVTQLERRDITEGLDGHPLRIGVQVVDQACAPIPGAMMEIWHCDIDGDYSAYTDGGTADDAGPGTTFFRGSQRSNDEGIVEFVTSYPGWYRGRAVYIHAKVHLDDTTVLTTQFFFEDEQNNAVFTEALYAEHGQPDTTNATDNIAGGDPAAQGMLMTVSDDPAIGGSRALIVVGVDPSASSRA